MGFAWAGTQTAKAIHSFGHGLSGILVGDKILGMAKKYVSKPGVRRAKKRLVKKARKARPSGRSFAVAGSEGVDQMSAYNFNPNGRQVGVMGSRKIVSFVYADRAGLSATTGGLAIAPVVFSLNGLFDPDVSGTGHQPRGFDQWMALFKRYKVFKVDVELRFDTTVDATNYKKCGCWRVVGPDQYTVTTAGFLTRDFIEQSNAGAIRILPNGEESLVRFSVNVPKLCGLKGLFDPSFNDNYSGSTAGNPGNPVYLQLAHTNDTATNDTACTVGVTIRYHAVLYEATLLTES